MDGQKATTGGLITTVRKILTKAGATMAFVGLETVRGDTELIVFPRAYEASPEMWEVDKVVVVQGKVNARDRDDKITEDVKMIVDKVKALDATVLKHYIATGESQSVEVPENVVREADRIIITLPDLKDQVGLLRIKTMLQSAPGDTEVLLHLTSSGQKIRLPFKVGVTQKLTRMLSSVTADDAVAVE
jgi:DNA polymerase-3 subunit alpha